jgi:hypothetical protein
VVGKGFMPRCQEFPLQVLSLLLPSDEIRRCPPSPSRLYMCYSMRAVDTRRKNTAMHSDQESTLCQEDGL